MFFPWCSQPSFAGRSLCFPRPLAGAVGTVGPMYAGKGSGKGYGKGGYGKGGSKDAMSKGSKGTTSDAEASDVLVVGAGCTGALVAALLPEVARRRGRAAPRVAVWEWGRGPAGRMTSFWSESHGARVVADVGAQARQECRGARWVVVHKPGMFSEAMTCSEEFLGEDPFGIWY